MRQRFLLISLLIGAGTTTAASNSSTPVSYPITGEVDLLLPRYGGLYPQKPYTASNYLPTTSFPVIFAYQSNINLNSTPIALRPRILWSVYEVLGDSTQAQIYGVTTDLSELSTPNNLINIDDTPATGVSQYYLTFNLSSLIDLTQPGSYILHWSFYARNCSSDTPRTTWRDSSYFSHPNQEQVESYKPPVSQFQGTDLIWFNITTADVDPNAKDTHDPDTLLPEDEKWCPRANVVLTATGEVTIETEDPTALEIGEEKNFQCAVLQPRKVNEMGYLSFGEGYTEGTPCKANFGSREKAEEVLKAFLGEEWKEKGTDDAKPNGACSTGTWRVGGVGSVMAGHVLLAAAAAGALILA